MNNKEGNNKSGGRAIVRPHSNKPKPHAEGLKGLKEVNY
jgi:hypothetical protein